MIFDKWFKPKYSVCAECGVYYDVDNSIYGYLCKTHRKPHEDKFRRKEAVKEWAARNWEKLEGQVKEEKRIFDAEYNAHMQGQYAKMQGQYAKMQGASNQLGNIFGSTLSSVGLYPNPKPKE